MYIFIMYTDLHRIQSDSGEVVLRVKAKDSTPQMQIFIYHSCITSQMYENVTKCDAVVTTLYVAYHFNKYNHQHRSFN